MSGHGGNPHSLRDLRGHYEKSGLSLIIAGSGREFSSLKSRIQGIDIGGYMVERVVELVHGFFCFGELKTNRFYRRLLLFHANLR
jgi:hypothetical protein